ncbi:MAG: ADP-dependent NAD(P)H-hydrate dehydratase / NAD(P)H-hydrate epimerase [Candidatus Cloacimonadota bacterium]|nr:ADP-dependent NAD(P)H-hydrate dehydratase / NAD(P)H-hydrate epimerase [Candidatus Cloacimonadota bacterium]
MRIVLSRAQMREMDLRTIQEFGISSQVLMETAGARAADIIRTRYAQELPQGVVLLCGRGNNGGDGYVIARHLYADYNPIQIFSIGDSQLSPETEHNRSLCEKLGIPILDLQAAEQLSTLLAFQNMQPALVIDAIYGIGFHGDLPPLVKEILQSFENIAAIKIAVDIPSGIDADTGNGYALKMDLTLVIEDLKYGHLLNAGRLATGEKVIVPIGIPASYKEEISTYHYQDLILPLRYPDAHKGTYGRVFIIGGSIGFLGSVKLASKAALRSGAGLIYLYTRADNLPFYGNIPDEIMLTPIAQQDEGNLPDPEKMQQAIAQADAIAIGCGLGMDSFALELLRLVLTHSKVPTICDADALSLIAKNDDLVPLLSKGSFLLTPHKAEFCRLAKITMDQLNQDPIAALRDYQAKVQCAILLKGHSSIYLDSTRSYILTAGNDALATGGSGDMLAGIISSFAAQGLDLPLAACSASYLMGRTAERLAAQQHAYSLTPADIIAHLGDIYE